jgi:alkylation response protein AidB-like acyl-CoA dehydrogenase
LNIHTSAESAPGEPQAPSAEDLAALEESIGDVLAAECDRRSVHEFIDGKSALDETLWAKAAELGWLAAGLPEAWGGLDLGLWGLTVLHRQLGAWLAPGPYISTLAAAQWLVETAPDSVSQALLPRIVAGELKIATPAHCAPSPGLEMAAGKVSGRSAPLLGSQDAGLAIVPVGGAWALIDTREVGARLEAQPTWDRTRQLCVLACEGARPLAMIADEDGAAMRALGRQLALAVAADSLGGAASVSRQTIEYMKTRVQFDRPIGSFQALKHRAADLVILTTTQDNLLEQAVETAERRSPDADMWAALAKAGATGVYAFTASDCVLLHGGVGFTWEYDCHIFLKRARLNEALGLSNPEEYDLAAAALTRAAREGRSTAELMR